MTATYTPGPWRWEFNREHRSVHLVGGVPEFDLTIMDFTRWGMNGAGICLRDTAHDGMNIMHKLHEREDWIEPFEGRKHHQKWCANVAHPDMRLMAAAPDLLAVAQNALPGLRREYVELAEKYAGTPFESDVSYQEVKARYINARDAIAKAMGTSA